ncbi:MAG: ABC transporter ATP-binding protein [Pseudomonadota bacterium]
MLKATDLHFGYEGGDILNGVSARIEPSRILSIVGPNGTGKTTLMKCILGILRPRTGTVRINGRNILSMQRRQIAQSLGYVPQAIPSRFSASVFETVLTGRRPHISWRPSTRDLDVTAQVMTSLNLDDLAMRDMARLSGGQAQKVLLARALVQETPYLLLDEPTSNLDLRHQLEMLEIIAQLSREQGMGVMMAMHDLNLAARFSDTILMLSQGAVACSGPPHTVMTPENIRTVYGVDARVSTENGYLYIQPLRCSGAPPATLVSVNGQKPKPIGEGAW